MAGYVEYSGFHTVYFTRSSYNSAAPRHGLASGTNQLPGFEQKYNGFEFMKELVDAMTAVDPGKRLTIEEVVANFSRICESSRAFKLRFPTTDNRSWLGKRISLRVEVKSCDS